MIRDDDESDFAPAERPGRGAIVGPTTGTCDAELSGDGYARSASKNSKEPVWSDIQVVVSPSVPPGTAWLVDMDRMQAGVFRSFAMPPELLAGPNIRTSEEIRFRNEDMACQIADRLAAFRISPFRLGDEIAARRRCVSVEKLPRLKFGRGGRRKRARRSSSARGRLR